MNRASTGNLGRSGFTLVELMLVVVLMSIVAASVIPALGNVQAMREGAARDDIVRYLEIAKARAMASGMPCGLEVDMSSSSLTMVCIDDAGSVETLIDPLTADQRSLEIPTTYGGVTLDSFSGGSALSASGVVWFDFEAKPHTRSSDGTFVSLNSAAVTLELSSQQRIVVHPYSGVIETP